MQLVPKGVGTTHADIWIGDFRAPPRPATVVLRARAHGDTAWFWSQRCPRWTRAFGAGPDVWWWLARMDGLEANTRYELELVGTSHEREQPLAHSSAKTLPRALPSIGGTGARRPFTLFLGSCFAVDRDPRGDVGAAYAKLRASAQHRPHVKLLLGDQVYLDTPVARWALPPPVPFWPLTTTALTNYLRRTLLSTYRRTWTQGDDHGGFRALLAHGATLLSADDHELWNDYPHVPAWLPALHIASWRRLWRDSARTLFRSIQSPTPVQRLDVGALSVLRLDTRIERTPRRFLSVQAFARLRDWVRGLRGPGVLALGQPLLTGPGKRGLDHNLADYPAQYRRLLRLLRRSPHDLVVLAGDAHFGRIASVPLRPGSSKRLVEIVSSPMALVDPVAGAGWAPSTDGEHPTSPATEQDGLPPLPITFHRTVRPTGASASHAQTRTPDHAMTLGFATRDDGAIELTVNAWLMDGASRSLAALPPRAFTWRTTFDRPDLNTTTQVA